MTSTRKTLLKLAGVSSSTFKTLLPFFKGGASELKAAIKAGTSPLELAAANKLPVSGFLAKDLAKGSLQGNRALYTAPVDRAILDLAANAEGRQAAKLLAQGRQANVEAGALASGAAIRGLPSVGTGQLPREAALLAKKSKEVGSDALSLNRQALDKMVTGRSLRNASEGTNILAKINAESPEGYAAIKKLEALTSRFNPLSRTAREPARMSVGDLAGFTRKKFVPPSLATTKQLRAAGKEGQEAALTAGYLSGGAGTKPLPFQAAGLSPSEVAVASRKGGRLQELADLTRTGVTPGSPQFFTIKA